MRFAGILLLLLCLAYLPLSSQPMPKLKGDSWKEINKKGSGEITVLWFDIEPYIYLDGSQIDGIEYQIFQRFIAFLEKEYQLKVKVNWQKSSSFAQVLELIKNSKEPGIFGISSFSITDERQQYVNFSPSYIPDLSVLISSENIPIAQNASEFAKIFKDKKAVTIPNTTFESDLLKLKSKLLPDITIDYVANDNFIIDRISSEKDYFGYCSLPIYILALQDGYELKRQNYFQIKREGYSFIYPQKSDWSLPLEDFFSRKENKQQINAIIKEYLGQNASELIWETLSWDSVYYRENEINILTREKEIQHNQLMESSIRTERQNIILIAVMLVLALLLPLVFFLYRSNYQRKRTNEMLLKRREENDRINKTLLEKFDEIEKQREDIRLKNLELEGKNGELTNLNHEKNELIGILAHDLRNPISQIIGLVHILERSETPLNEDQAALVQKIDQSAQRLISMLNKILDVEALEAKGSSIQLQKSNSQELLTEIIDGMEPLALEKRITLVRDFQAKDLCIYVDPTFFRQVIENVVSNALKYSPSESQVIIRSEEWHKKLAITVQDYGQGISPEELNKLFTKYQQLSSKPTGDEKSTGLGLAIVKKYVEAMNGHVEVRSEVGKGSSFILTFPLK
ncbi:ATP-binding protein [Cytophagales bacterium LB-30]|uniref:histidine kinase n=2 Tax=Shiella aurantiaca TaxID=3058365 RepID=A0ABT8F935_9BACT|nr:ATP-binding protein [Shiella aurantiaca]